MPTIADLVNSGAIVRIEVDLAPPAQPMRQAVRNEAHGACYALCRGVVDLAGEEADGDAGDGMIVVRVEYRSAEAHHGVA